jgi:hypothetical protein
MKLSIENSLFQPGVGVHAPVAQEWPMGAMLVYPRPVYFGHYNLFFVHRAFRHDFAIRSADETLSPKFNPFTAATCCKWRGFVTNPIGCRHVAAVGYGVTALNCLPSRMLSSAKFFFLAGMPANRCWIENNFRTAEGSQPCCLGVPLIPTNAHPDVAMSGSPCLKSEVSWCELKFLVIKRIIRDVHFAVSPKKFSIGIDDRRRVVIHTGSALLEERGDDDHPQLACDLLQG